MAHQYSLCYDDGGRDAVLTNIIRAIADVEGDEPTDLRPPLYDVIDPEALESLVRNPDATVIISFIYRGWEIEIRDRKIEISESERESKIYRCSCFTCESNLYFTSREEGQKVFNEHMDRHHEVELVKVEDQTEISDLDLEKADSAETIDGPAGDAKNGAPADE